MDTYLLVDDILSCLDLTNPGWSVDLIEVFYPGIMKISSDALHLGNLQFLGNGYGRHFWESLLASISQ